MRRCLPKYERASHRRSFPQRMDHGLSTTTYGIHAISTAGMSECYQERRRPRLVRRLGEWCTENLRGIDIILILTIGPAVDAHRFSKGCLDKCVVVECYNGCFIFVPSSDKHTKPVRWRVLTGCALSGRDEITQQPGYLKEDTPVTEPFILAKPRVVLCEKGQPVLKVSRRKIGKDFRCIRPQQVKDLLAQFS